MFSALVFIFFIVLPAIAIFAYASRLTSGVYHWADRQHPTPNYQYPVPYHERIVEETITTTTTRTTHPSTKYDVTPEEEYLGHSEQFEDSPQFAKILDSKRFDVRDYLK
jgi:hypothetical protein